LRNDFPLGSLRSGRELRNPAVSSVVGFRRVLGFSSARFAPVFLSQGRFLHRFWPVSCFCRLGVCGFLFSLLASPFVDSGFLVSDWRLCVFRLAFVPVAAGLSITVLPVGGKLRPNLFHGPRPIPGTFQDRRRS
jgi:hypothetical protein